MGSAKKNLLEAFRNAGEVPLPQDEKRDEALQPLTPEEERVLNEETRLQSDLTQGGRHSWRSELPAMPPWLLYLAVAGVLLVIALGVMGRGDDVNAAPGDGEAAGPAAESVVENQVVTPAPEQPATPRTETPAPMEQGQQAAQDAGPNAALLDRANAWTLVVITYSSSATSADDLAWATYDHLIAEGIPAFPPLGIGNKIVVLAGAAQRSSDLSELKSRIGSIARDGRANIYAGAYAERIDKFIER